MYFLPRGHVNRRNKRRRGIRTHGENNPGVSLSPFLSIGSMEIHRPMLESLPNRVSWTNLLAEISRLKNQHASPKPPDGENQESQK
jgi:hypothetical protein